MKTEDFKHLAQFIEKLKKGQTNTRVRWDLPCEFNAEIRHRIMKLGASLNIVGGDSRIDIKRYQDIGGLTAKTTAKFEFSFGWFSTIEIVLRRNNDPYTFKGIKDYPESADNADFKLVSFAIKGDGVHWSSAKDYDRGLADFTLTKDNKTEIKKYLNSLIEELGKWQDLQSPRIMEEAIRYQDELKREVDEIAAQENIEKFEEECLQNNGNIII